MELCCPHVPMLHGIVDDTSFVVFEHAQGRTLEYLRHLHVEGLAVPVLFACLLGFRLECVMVDVLHTVDQGVANHIVASVIWLVAV
eukprot:8118461-Pyramimonas_sp.AAC.1